MSPPAPSSTTARSRALATLDGEVVECRQCPRLVSWCEEVAANPRASFRGDHYWGKPVPGFGDPDAEILIVGLAPAAHGANRTGRMFTGDRSGDWLYSALHRAGFANQPTARSADDGLRLDRVRVTAAVRCAPPANKPTTAERDTCAPYLAREIQILRPSVFVILGGFAYQALWRQFREGGVALPSPRPAFGHGAEVHVDSVGPKPATLLCCYHPSQQNTFTGRLTEEMLDDVFGRARELADIAKREER